MSGPACSDERNDIARRAMRRVHLHTAMHHLAAALLLSRDAGDEALLLDLVRRLAFVERRTANQNQNERNNNDHERQSGA